MESHTQVALRGQKHATYVIKPNLATQLLMRATTIDVF